MFSKKAVARTLSVLSLAMLATSSFAADPVDDRKYLTFSLSHLMADDDRRAEDGQGVALGFGLPFLGIEHIRMEGTLFRDKMDPENVAGAPGEYKQAGVMIDLLFLLTQNRNFQPYIVGGLGWARNRVGVVNENGNLMNELGIGANIRVKSWMKVRADVRYRVDEIDRNQMGPAIAALQEKQFGDWVTSLAVVFPLGEERQADPVEEPIPVALAPVVVAPRDGDNDGVMDDADRCPDSPVGAPVNAEGCEPDSDGDGVVDSKDACPGTPAGALVDATGCRLDSDRDGIVDGEDRCPRTPAGTRVDASGCAEKAAGKPAAKEVIDLKGVTFYSNSARLTPDSTAILDKAAEAILTRKLSRVEVAGHTDSRGSDAHNLALSQNRSETVMLYLVDKGVSEGVLTARGYGETQPVADNTSKEGQDANRRVELRVVE